MVLLSAEIIGQTREMKLPTSVASQPESTPLNLNQDKDFNLTLSLALMSSLKPHSFDTSFSPLPVIEKNLAEFPQKNPPFTPELNLDSPLLRKLVATGEAVPAVMHRHKRDPLTSSRPYLEALGIEIIAQGMDKRYFRIKIPEGWTCQFAVNGTYVFNKDNNLMYGTSSHFVHRNQQSHALHPSFVMI